MKRTTPPPKQKKSEAYTAVHEWLKAKLALADAKKAELELRRVAIAKLFPDDSVLKEGTNSLTLVTSDAQECVCKVGMKINRDLEVSVLSHVMPRLPKHLQAEGKLIKWKPGLVLSTYREMTEAERRIFDEAVTSSPGELTLEAVIQEKL